MKVAPRLAPIHLTRLRTCILAFAFWQFGSVCALAETREVAAPDPFIEAIANIKMSVAPISCMRQTGAAVWFAQLGAHTGYVAGVLGPLVLTGVGLGMVIAPSINTGTFGVAPQDAGVASASVTVGQQLGASIGTSLLNTIFASAVTSYIAAHLASARAHGLIGRQALAGLALAHGYDTAFWWTAGILAGGSVAAALLFRRGPLYSRNTPAAGQTGNRAGDQAVEAGPAIPA